MNLLVAYDIAHPRRLQRIAKVMQDYGLRVQKSVFEIEITPVKLAELRRRAEAEMDMTVDGVKYFPLCGDCDHVWLALGVDGQGQVEDGPWVII
ncbi:MAG: CRISPR-associated endonuclease Cas2 [Deltaproteobacteria bacterium]|nr:CRISPR-associated endonuclease Cas2 [Deltaproteobacteria bacterium]